MGYDLTRTGPLQDIYAALAAQLQAVFPEPKFQHGYVPTKPDPNVWRGYAKRAPFIGLGWARLDPAPQNDALLRVDSTWHVYLIVRNERGDAPRFLGDRLGFGLFALIQAASVALHRLQIGGIGPVSVTDAGEALAHGWADDAAVLGLVSLSVPVVLSPADIGTTPAALQAFAGRWVLEAPDADHQRPDQ